MQQIPTPPAFGFSTHHLHLHLTSQDSSCHLSDRASQAIEKDNQVRSFYKTLIHSFFCVNWLTLICSHIVRPPNVVIRAELQLLQPAAGIIMASNNRDPVVGSVDNNNSPIVQRAIAFGKAIPDLVKECERAGEARASSRLASKIDQQESTIKTLEGWFKLSEENNAELKECLTASEKQIACLRRLLTVSKKRTAEVEAKAQVDADARIAQHTSDLEARNAQMVETVAETVEKLKRDAAARVAAAETHSQDCIDEYRDKTDSQFRQLSRELDRHIDMLGLARIVFQSPLPNARTKHVRRKAYRMGSTQTVSSSK